MLGVENTKIQANGASGKITLIPATTPNLELKNLRERIYPK